MSLHKSVEPYRASHDVPLHSLHLHLERCAFFGLIYHVDIKLGVEVLGVKWEKFSLPTSAYPHNLTIV